MKICIVAQNLDIKNGGGRSAFSFADGFKKAGHEVIALTKESSGLDFEKPLISNSIIKSIFKARTFLKGCVIVNAHDVWPYGVIIFFANLGTKRKLVITSNGTYSVLPFCQKGLAGYVKKKLSEIALRGADAAVAISRYTASEMNRFVSDVKINVINLGVDSDKFAKSVLPEKSISLTESLKPYILGVGAVKHRKGYHNSIKAFSLIKDEYPDLKYVIVGPHQESDSYKKEMDNLIKESGLEGRVLFFRDLLDEELAAFYWNSDFFILTSVNEEGCVFEGLGLVYLEAGSCGKAVIGTLGCGAEDAIDDNNTGFLVPQENVAATVDAIKKLLQDKELSKKMGSRGIIKAQDMSWDNATKKALALFETLF
jgi:glycosyltransferase involved in cell wall biosynthesis